MRNFKLSLVVAFSFAAMLAAIAIPAQAVTTQWNKGAYLDLNPVDTIADTGTWLWTDAANWSAGVPVNGIGDTINFVRLNWAAPVGIDTKGATLALGNTAVTGAYNGSVEVIFDSTYLTPVYKATPVPNTILPNATSFDPSLTGYASLTAAANASPTLTVASMNYSKQHQLYLYQPLHVTGSITTSGTNLSLYGNVTVDGAMNFTGGNQAENIRFFGTLSAPSSTMTVGNATVNVSDTATLGTINLSNNSAGYHAQAGASSGGASAIINVNSGALYFDVQQTTFPAQVNVAAYAAIEGDFTGATYGTNVILADNAILGITAGPLPTDPDALTPDAKYWLAATSPASAAVYEASNDPDSIYKGVAFSNALMASGNAACTFQTAAGSAANLQVLVTGGSRKKDNAMTWLADTGIADIYCNATTLIGDGGAINNNYSGPRTKVTTFNFHNMNTAADAEAFDLYNHGGSGKILAGQTYSVENGRLTVSGSEGNILGTLKIDDGGMLYMGTDNKLGASATVQINNGGAVTVRNNKMDAMNNLAPGQITMSGTYYVAFYDNSNTSSVYYLTVNNAANPNLATLMAGAASIGLNYHDDRIWDFNGDGLALQDGQFLVTDGYQNKTTTIDAASIFGAAAGATKIGLAAGVGQTLKIDCPLNLGAGVDLNIGSSTLEIVSSENQRDTAGGQVYLNGAVTAKNINVASGNQIRFLDSASLNLTGKVAVTGGTVQVLGNADNFDDAQAVTMQFDGGKFDAEQDGGAIDLAKTSIALNAGSYGASTSSNLTVKNLSIAQKYVSGSAGMKINDDNDTVTVTGTLSGNGGWGGNAGAIMRIAATGTLAPGGSVGELTGATKLDMVSGAIYEWQIANPTPGGAGTTGWDLITADTIAFASGVTLKIMADGLASDITAGQSFDIAVATGAAGITGYAGITFSYDDPSKWTGTPSLTYTAGTKTLSLSGLVYSAGPVVVLGDADNNGIVDAADYIFIKEHFGQVVSGGAVNGDLDGSGTIDWGDLQMLMTAMAPAPSVSVQTPEPATLGLLAIGALAVIRRRRKS